MYLNAAEVLPPELLEEIQKYAGGKLLYVPNKEELQRDWGELSGQKQYYRKRNRMLRNKYLYGVSVDALAKEYSLSAETVKKIVYVKKERDELPFSPDIASARAYNESNLLEEWIHTYLLFERKNKGFSDGLYQEKRFYLGPFAMPLGMLSRNCGPEENMKWRVHPVVFEEHVAAWQEKIRTEQLLPPIIVGFADGAFEINCNSQLFEALLREGVTYFPVLVWTTKEADYKDFMERFSPYTEFVLK